MWFGALSWNAKAIWEVRGATLVCLHPFMWPPAQPCVLAVSFSCGENETFLQLHWDKENKDTLKNIYARPFPFQFTLFRHCSVTSDKASVTSQNANVTQPVWKMDSVRFNGRQRRRRRNEVVQEWIIHWGERDRGRESARPSEAVARESMSCRDHLSATSASESPSYRSVVSKRLGKCTIKVRRRDALSLVPADHLARQNQSGEDGNDRRDEYNCGGVRTGSLIRLAATETNSRVWVCPARQFNYDS